VEQGINKKILEAVLEKLNKATFRRNRIGMYGETPRIVVDGNLNMCLMDPDGKNKSVWISNLQEEGGEFQIADLTWPISEFFEKNM